LHPTFSRIKDWFFAISLIRILLMPLAFTAQVFLPSGSFMAKKIQCAAKGKGVRDYVNIKKQG